VAEEYATILEDTTASTNKQNSRLQCPVIEHGIHGYTLCQTKLDTNATVKQKKLTLPLVFLSWDFILATAFLSGQQKLHGNFISFESFKSTFVIVLVLVH
jgi:hypothetical protein